MKTIKYDWEETYEFDPDVRYIIRLDNRIEFGRIDKNILSRVYKDGRVFGLIGEYLFESLFTNVIKASDDNGSPYDCVYVDGDKLYKVEIRTVTKSGTTTVPNICVGGGGCYDYEKHLDKLCIVDYFVFMDIRSFPIVDIITLPSDDERLFVKRITPKMFDRMVSK